MDDNLKLSVLIEFLLSGGDALGQARAQTEGLAASAEQLSQAETQASSTGANLTTTLVQTGGAAQATSGDFLKMGMGMQMLSGQLDRIGESFLAFGTAIVGALAGATDEAAKFDRMIAQVAGNTSLTSEQVQGMSDSVLKLGAESGAPLDQLAQGFMRVSNFGFQAGDAVKVLDAAQKSATSSGGDVGATANLLAKVMHQYAMGADEAGKAMNILHQASADGNMTLEEFTNVSGPAFAMAHTLGISVQEAAAAMSAMTRQGFSASEAATQFRNILSHIEAPSSKAAKAIAELSKTSGVDLVSDFSGAGLASKGLAAILDDVAQATGGDADKMKELIPALRGGLGQMVLVKGGAQDFKEELSKLADVWSGKLDPTAQASARTMETLGQQLERVKTVVLELAITIGQALEPIFEPITKRAADFIETVVGFAKAHPALIQLAAGIAGVAAGIAIVGGITLVAAGSMAGMIAVGAMLAGTLGGVAVTGVAAAGGVAGIGIASVASLPGIAAMGAGLWTALAPLLPILAVVLVGVAALAGLAYEVYKNWDSVSDVLTGIESTWNDWTTGISIAKTNLAGLLKPLAGVWDVITTIYSLWKEMWEWVMLGPLKGLWEYFGARGHAENAEHPKPAGPSIIDTATAKVKGVMKDAGLDPDAGKDALAKSEVDKTERATQAAKDRTVLDDPNVSDYDKATYRAKTKYTEDKAAGVDDATATAAYQAALRKAESERLEAAKQVADATKRDADAANKKADRTEQHAQITDYSLQRSVLEAQGDKAGAERLRLQELGANAVRSGGMTQAQSDALVRGGVAAFGANQDAAKQQKDGVSVTRQPSQTGESGTYHTIDARIRLESDKQLDKDVVNKYFDEKMTEWANGLEGYNLYGRG